MREESSEQVESWLHALLRYAITRRAQDRMAAEAIAGSMDARGTRFAAPEFDFFARSSRRVCDAIASNDAAARGDIEQFLQWIETPRLRRAFDAALDATRAPSTIQSRAWLWKGLEREAR